MSFLTTLIHSSSDLISRTFQIGSKLRRIFHLAPQSTLDYVIKFWHRLHQPSSPEQWVTVAQ